MRFTLTIELSNDAMQTGADVIKALRNSLKGEEDLSFDRPISGRLWDENGNIVGSWEAEDETACAVCGVPAPDHGHYSATDPKTHQWKARREGQPAVTPYVYQEATSNRTV